MKSLEIKTTFVALMRSSKLYPWTLALAGLFFLLTLLLPIWRIVPLSSQLTFIPLHYNVYFGVDQFGPWQQVFVLPALGLFLLIVNLVVQTIFFPYEKIMAKMFAVASVFVELGLFVAMSFIVLLNL